MATKPFKFIVGCEGLEFYIYQTLVSRLSTPLNALVNSWAKESSKDSVTWGDVESDVFLRFVQFAYFGTYTIENTGHAKHPEEVIEIVSDSEKPSQPVVQGLFSANKTVQRGNATSLFGGSATSLFGSSAPPGVFTTRIAGADDFKLPYSLASYKAAAVGPREWLSKTQKPNKRGAKRKIDALAHDDSDPGGTSPSEKKLNFIWTFIAKQDGHDATSSNGWQNISQAQTGSFENVFIGHAKIWTFATKYSINSLMDLACKKLAHELVQWTISVSTFVPEFGGLVRYVYNDCTTAESQLRQLVAQFAACVVEDVGGLEGWRLLLNEVPDFAVDLLSQVTNRFG